MRISFIVLLISLIPIHVIGQWRNYDILSDSTKFAEFIYMNMHYPLV